MIWDALYINGFCRQKLQFLQICLQIFNIYLSSALKIIYIPTFIPDSYFHKENIFLMKSESWETTQNQNVSLKVKWKN